MLEKFNRHVILVLYISVLYTPVVFLAGFDFLPHLRWAQELSLYGKTPLSHYLFQQVTIIIRVLIPFHLIERFIPHWAEVETTWTIAGVVCVVLFTILLGEVIYMRLMKITEPWKPNIAYRLSLLLTISLLLVAPITIFTWGQQRLLFGYIGINVYHNPTILLLKPLALILSWKICEMLFSVGRARDVIWLFILSMLTLQAKPSYTLILLPALVLAIGYQLSRRRSFALVGAHDWLYCSILFSFSLPVLDNLLK